MKRAEESPTLIFKPNENRAGLTKPGIAPGTIFARLMSSQLPVSVRDGEKSLSVEGQRFPIPPGHLRESLLKNDRRDDDNALVERCHRARCRAHTKTFCDFRGDDGTNLVIHQISANQTTLSLEITLGGIQSCDDNLNHETALLCSIRSRRGIRLFGIFRDQTHSTNQQLKIIDWIKWRILLSISSSICPRSSIKGKIEGGTNNPRSA